MIKEIWNKYNISTLLILPIFNDILDNITSKQGHRYTLHGLLFNNGLKLAYLYEADDPENSSNTLKLLLNRSKIFEKVNAGRKYYSLLDILINSSHYSHLRDYNEDYIVVYLKIPDEFLDDVNKIVNYKYSTVSNLYKGRILLEGDVLLTEDETINYIILKNFSARIVNKSRDLLELLSEFFSTPQSFIENNEYFFSFDINKETLN